MDKKNLIWLLLSLCVLLALIVAVGIFVVRLSAPPVQEGRIKPASIGRPPYEASSAPSAAIDARTLTTPSLEGASLSGTATGVDSVVVVLTDTAGESFWHSEITPVVNGGWAVTISLTPNTMPAGQYQVIVNDPAANPNNGNRFHLTTATLHVGK